MNYYCISPEERVVKKSWAVKLMQFLSPPRAFEQGLFLFSPMQACLLEWRSHPIPGVTFGHNSHYLSPFAVFRLRREERGGGGAAAANTTAAAAASAADSSQVDCLKEEEGQRERVFSLITSVQSCQKNL